MNIEELYAAAEKVRIQESDPIPLSEHHDLLEDPSRNWEKFYETHENKFFKNRKWLEIEFRKELVVDGSIRILEVGCGVGDSIFPLLEANKSNDDFFIYGCDYSSTAIQVLKSNAMYNPKKCLAFVHDITTNFTQIEPNSINVITMIFVASAIPPSKLHDSLKILYDLLKPGGVILFRDYGQYDLVQLRFKRNRCLSPGLYRRGDNTLVRFLTTSDLAKLVSGCGFVVDQCTVDKRLLVNRKTEASMHRVWLQGKFRKP